MPTIERVDLNGQEVRHLTTITNLPNQSLYRINKDNPNVPLLETDPAYTHYRQWLGSDYMLRALGQDPALMHKRLGDGYVEQRLVREQIAQLTGRVRLEGYATEEAQFQALLDAGITFAERFHLTPGVSLSPEMLAQLTSDIVWLEDETVKLPDGTTETVLVPKVYVVVRPGDLDGSGSLIAADTLQLNLSRQLENQGTLAGRRVMQINADTIQNLGRIEGGEVALRTNGDLVNLGGTIHGKDRVALQAGRDLRSHSSLYHTSNKDDVNTTSRTDILRVAGIYATNPNAQVLLDAARDVELKASQVGSEGQVVIRAGRDVRLGSLTTNVDERSVVDEWNQIQRRRTSDVGSNVTAKGDVDIVSARETSLHASVLKADGDVKINAGKAVRVEAGKSVAYDKVASTQKDSGLLSSSEKRHRYEVETTNALSSVINGKAVSIASGGDVNVVGSRVISEDRTDIDAAGAINIKASENTRIESEARYEKKSGFTASLSHGVASIGYGRQTLNATATREASSLTQSEVGSLKGDATLVANQAVTVKGSTIAAGRDLTVRGSDIRVENGEATHQSSSSVKTTQSGFSLGVTYNRQAAMKGAIEKQWKDDAATHLGWVGQSVRAGYAYAEGVMASHTPVVITLGQQKHRAQHQTEGQEVVKSELGANGALQLIAHEGDIRIVGSRVRAEGEATLAAKENLHVEAAHQRQSENASSKRSGFSLDDRNWVAPVGSFNDQRKEGAQIDQAIGSELSFGEKAQLLTEKGDIHVEGSSIVAANDLTLQSGRDVVIKSATSTQSSRAEQSSRGIGAVQISDTERFVGYIASKQENDGVSSTLNRSQVGSLTGNVTIDAKGDYRQQVADIVAGKDINITANTITVQADHQTQFQDSSASDSKVGVFAKVSSPLIDLAQVTETAVKSKADDRTKALQTLATGAQGYITYDSVSKGNIAKGEVGLGVRSSKQNSESELRISQGNLLRADGDVRLTTREGDVALTHTTVEAGGNVHIDSARDIVLKAGETTQTAKGSNKNAGVGVGVGVSVGAQTGVYGYVEASLGSGKQNLEAKTYEITTVQGKQVDLKSARDTTLKGAQVHGDRVDVHTGGNLTIESLQDHVEQEFSQSGMGARVQVSLGTAWDASGNVSQSKAKGKTDAVNQQSGLFAGQGGYHINAEKVTLVGGVIVSTATEENNELSTNRLDFKHLESHSEYDAYSASMAASYGDKNKTTTGKSTGIDQSGQFNMLPTLPVREQGEDQSTTYATISPGKITVNGELVDLKTLGIHTDASTVHRSVSALPDLAALQAKQQQISQAVSTIAQAAETYRQNQWLAAENAKAKARAEAEERLKQQGGGAWSAYQTLSENDKALQLEMTDASYRQALIETRRWGIGGDKARLTQATTTLVMSVLAGQSVSQVTVNTVATYASKLVGDAFAHGEDPEPLKQAMGHFVVGAAMAYVNGANPLAGGSAAVAAEKASAVLAEMYNDGVTAINEKGEFDPALLPEEAKLEISSLTGAIAGMVMATGDGGAVLNAQIGSVVGKNTSDNNSLRLFISIGRITYKIYRYYKKVGKLRSIDIVRMVIDEGLSIADDLTKLTDGELNLDDALAALDLVTSINLKTPKLSIVKRNPNLSNHIQNGIDSLLKNDKHLKNIDINKPSSTNPIPTNLLKEALKILKYKQVKVIKYSNEKK